MAIAMPIAMPDSTTPGNMPDGYGAYLGYVDGAWATAPELRKMFPGAVIVSLTVTGGTLDADGCDCEPGDLSDGSAASWIARKLATGYKRPILYASISDMPTALNIMAELNVPRTEVRLLSAHYGVGEHICGPSTCAYPGVTGLMDGTQWTDSYPGVNGQPIDMSLLQDNFFGSTPLPPSLQYAEFDMTKIRVLKLGDVDKPGEFWAVERLQDVLRRYGLLNGVTDAEVITDGTFGQKTDKGVRAMQSHAKITVDGEVGPATWSVLLTGSAQ